MLAVAYGTSWAVAAALWATGGIHTPFRKAAGGFAFMLGPAIAALVVTRKMPWPRRREVLALRHGSSRWLLAAWLVPATIVAVATLGSVLVPGTNLLSPATALRSVVLAHSAAEAVKLDRIPAPLLSGLLVIQAFVIGPLFNAPFMLSEELGWRGFLWSEWRAIGFMKSAVVTGVVWGLWHAPLIAMGHNYPDAPIAGIGIMTVFCVLLTPPLHHIRDRGGSIAHACVFHGTINAGATLGALCIESPTWIGRGIVGLPGLATLTIAFAIVAVARRASSRARSEVRTPDARPQTSSTLPKDTDG
jgi:hypothetical protein